MSDSRSDELGAANTVPAADAPAVDSTLTDPGAGNRPRKPAETDPRRVVAEGEYEVLGEVARGGMGRILRARDHRHHREVAIKEALASSTGSRARFAREALITARLQHPGIVPVYELASWRNGEAFFAMRLVDGRSLSAAIADADTVEKRMALLPNVINAVEAIAYAHRQRVIHRDLKPSNILVGELGETVVIDWGLAKDLDTDELDSVTPSTSSESDVTVAGSVIGTPSYMPVEQAEGETLDERADVYALGAILYHVLSGKPPFRAASGEAVLDLVREQAPAPLSSLATSIPADLITIVEKAMCRRREDRYANAAVLAGELQRFTTGQLVGAHRYSTLELIGRRLKRHRGVVGVSIAAAVTLIALGAFSISQIVAERNDARTARAQAEQAQARAEVAQTEADAQRSRAENLVDFVIADLSEKLGPTGQVGLLKDVATRAHAYAATGDPDAVPTLDRQRRVAALLGDIRKDEGSMADAEVSFREELSLANRLAAKEKSVEAKVRVAVAHRRVAEALAEQGRRDAATAELERSRELLEGLKEIDVVIDVVDQELTEVFAVEGKVATIAASPGGQMALGIADIALSSKWETIKDDPETAAGMLVVRMRLADELSKAEPTKALPLYDAIVARLAESTIPEIVQSRMKARLAHGRARALANLGRDAEATRAYSQAEAISEALVKKPAGAGEDDVSRQELGVLRAERGLLLARSGKRAPAKKALRDAIKTLSAAATLDASAKKALAEAKAALETL